MHLSNKCYELAYTDNSPLILERTNYLSRPKPLAITDLEGCKNQNQSNQMGQDKHA